MSDPKKTHRPFQVRLPGFLAETQAKVGLGDVIKQASAKVGIRPCDGCRKRAATMNRWLVFSGPRK